MIGPWQRRVQSGVRKTATRDCYDDVLGRVEYPQPHLHLPAQNPPPLHTFPSVRGPIDSQISPQMLFPDNVWLMRKGYSD